MSNFDQLIDRIRANGEEITFDGPQASDAIEKLEKELCVKLPPSYRQFLSIYGAGGTKGAWIAGIYQNDPLQMNDGYVYGETKRVQNEYGLPHGLVVIQSSPPEVVWCLDLRRTNVDQEMPVVAVDVLHNFRTEQIAPSFAAFFNEYLEARC